MYGLAVDIFFHGFCLANFFQVPVENIREEIRHCLITGSGHVSRQPLQQERNVIFRSSVEMVSFNAFSLSNDNQCTSVTYKLWKKIAFTAGFYHSWAAAFGPVHKNAFSFENANTFLRFHVPSTRKRWKTCIVFDENALRVERFENATVFLLCVWRHQIFILEAIHSTKLILLYFLEFHELSLHAKFWVDMELLSGVTDVWISWQQSRVSRFWPLTKIDACVWI